MPKQVTKDHGFRTYRIFTELLRAEGGLTTPRQVVSFVNDVSGLFALHGGEFPLPTVAAYIAHQDLVSQNPSVLNDVSILNPKVVDLAADPNLAMNLAAIVFNVAPDLAFEVLLDNELVGAIVSTDYEDLERLSGSPGFDLRVDDVVQSNSEVWRSTGDFGLVVANFSKILPNYHGAAKSRIIDALVEGFARVERFSIANKEYQPFLLLFDIVEEKDRPNIVREYLLKGFEDASKLVNADFDAGQAFAEFLGQSRIKLEDLHLVDQFKIELSKLSPNTAPDFLCGLAWGFAEKGLEFGDLGGVEISLPTESNYFVDMAIEDPTSALVVLEQFALKPLLESSDWVEVANSCMQKCAEDGHSQEETAGLLDVTCFARSQLPKKSRAEISLSTAVTQGQFFRNLGDGESDESARAIALAIFLVGEAALGKQIAQPIKPQSNGPRINDVSEEYTQFNEIMTGESDLSIIQAEIIANRAKASSSIVENWTKFGSENETHSAVQKVIKAAYLNGALPNITLHDLNFYSDYLINLLGNEAFIEFLDRFEPCVTEVAMSNVQLENTSIEFFSKVNRAQGDNWNKYFDTIDALLKNISSSQWSDHLADFDHTARLLIEKLATSGCTLESSEFREPLVNTMLDILSSEDTSPMPDGAFDKLVKAIDSSFHAEIWRTLREKTKGVSSTSLDSAVRLFPNVLTNTISQGDRVLAAEKDNVIRHILCPALEGDNRFVLKVFVQMGNKRISDFKKSSHESTVAMLKGTLDSFSKSSDDHPWTTQVVEAVEGKRRARTLLEVLWGVNKDDD